MFNAKRIYEGDRDDPAVVPLMRDPVGPQSVGELLRQTRVHYGQTLRDAANALKIREAYIAAMEEGRVGDLPGPTYAVGFVRTYAEHLGLDPDAVVERFKDETVALDDQTQLVFPSPMPEGRVPSGAVVMIAILVAGLSYGGWLFLSADDRQVSDLLPSLPERFAAIVRPAERETGDAVAGGEVAPQDQMIASGGVVTGAGVTAPTPPATIPAPAVPSVAEAGPTAVEPNSVAGGLPQEPRSLALPWERGTADPRDSGARAIGAQVAGAAVSETATPETATPETATPETATPEAAATQNSEPESPNAVASAEAPPADAAPAESRVAVVGSLPPAPPAAGAVGPRQFGAEGDARIVLTAKRVSWVEVRDAAGRAVLMRLLQPGDSFRVPDEAGLTMMTGNAGGLEVSVDGKVLPPLGPLDGVRRNIRLEPGRLRALAAESGL